MKRVCKRCNTKVRKSDNPEYSWQCMNCDEDLYDFETTVIEERLCKNCAMYNDCFSVWKSLKGGKHAEICGTYKAKTMGDLLRGMSNEAMAKWFFYNYICNRYQNQSEECPHHESEQECIKCWLEYLSREMK